MTRKCILCKETNYKNSYSFFSAPKDVETRKKWQEAIAIENYTVSDDTYVCSRHFLPSDVITHWVSGIPPHVVTIKYKKCRLRPGAIPTTSCEVMNNMQNAQEDDEEDFEVNRAWIHTDRRPSGVEKKEFFLIPRDDKVVTYNSGESLLKINAKVKKSEIEDYSSAEVEECLQEQVVDMMMTNDEEGQVLEVINDDLQESGDTIDLKTDCLQPQIVYIEDIHCTTGFIKEEGEDAVVHDAIEVSPRTYQMSDEAESVDMWDSTHAEKGLNEEREEKSSEQIEDAIMDIGDSLNAKEETEEIDDGMLFEDLLDVYTEVPLPRGWSSVVISKGRGTTVIYAYMAMTKSGIPYAEKQVYFMSDMIIRCSAVGREINPRLHNLLREGRQLKVQTLVDVEDIIEEFDQRIVCEGSLEKINAENVDSTIGFRDGFKWRHMRCPIIINNGTSRCSKCSTLNAFGKRKKFKKPPQTAESAELLQKDRTIFVLQKLLSKQSKRNQRIETIKDNSPMKLHQEASDQEESLLRYLDTLNLPKIQKVMIEECLKSPVQERNNDFSETWTFLSLLLYMESPRTYRYLHINKFMNLPTIKLMKRYLHQIKTDAPFYKLFQRSIEPFNIAEMNDNSEPT